MKRTTTKEHKSTKNQGNTLRTTIALQNATKSRLDKSKSHGQAYDSFINELVNYWERYRIGSSLCGPGKPVQHDAEREG